MRWQQCWVWARPYILVWRSISSCSGTLRLFPELPSRQWRPPRPTSTGVPGVTLRTADGEALAGWFVRRRSACTLLYLHGNGGNIGTVSIRLRCFTGWAERFHHRLPRLWRQQRQAERGRTYQDALAA